METRFVTIEEALALHATALQLTHGKLGVHDIGALLGCLERPKTVLGGQEMFPTLFLKAAALTETIARNHPFVDGNKRTALFSAVRFLFINGHEFVATNLEAEEFPIIVEKTRPPISEIAKWFKSHCRKIKKGKTK